MKKQHYTLTEILVVLAIIGIVVALALPSFNRMVNGDKVTLAAKQLSAAIAQARSEAIVTGRPVALLLPSRKPNDTPNTNIKSSYGNCSYGIVVLNKEGTSIDTNRLANFKWQQLPSGTVICGIYNNFGIGDEYLNPDKSFAPLNFIQVNNIVFKRARDDKDADKSNDGDLGNIAAIIFKPDGTTDQKLDIFVTEGFINSSNKVEATNPDLNTGKDRPNNTLRLKLNQFTGRVSYENL